MPSVQTVGVSIITVLLLLALYRFVFNPQVVYKAGGGSVCPDQWSFSDGLCKPMYNTTCAAFDPNTITSAVQGCNLAKTCGTSWPGKCP